MRKEEALINNPCVEGAVAQDIINTIQANIS